jgi:predicted dehydrogenase
VLRIAIVGVGWAGTRHAEAVRELACRVQVDCLVDPDTAFLREKAKELGIRKTYTDFEQMLQDQDVDAVDICSPHSFHAPQAMAAAHAGKHVLVEKPMALSVEEATRMIQVAESNGVRLYVAENESYTSVSLALRHLVQTGQYIGELSTASVVKGFRAREYGYPGRRAWLSTPELGGTGTWMLHGIHAMAQLRFILGEVAIVYMRQHRTSSFARPDLEATMSGLLTLKSGVPVSVVQTCETRLYADLGGYALHGNQGSVRAWAEGYRVYSDEHQGVEMRYPEEGLSSYARQLEAFADCVEQGIEGPTTGLMERRSLAIVQAGYESAASGRPIDLEERFGAI